MELFIIGVVTALNLIIILNKFKAGRIEDGTFDATLLVLVTIVFMGSYAGLVVATVASLLISIYLWASPPKFFSGGSGLFSQLKQGFKDLG